MQKFRQFNKLAFNGGKPLFKYKDKHFMAQRKEMLLKKC